MITTFQRIRERGIHGALFLCAVVSIFTTAAIIWVLLSESYHFFHHPDVDISLTEFLFGTKWAPLLAPQSFGVLPLICGTAHVAIGSLIIAIPVGLGAAVFLSEYAPKAFRAVGKPMLEILAGIPTVVYGYFALTFVTPHILQPLFPDTQIYNAAAAAIVVGIMIIPTVASLSDDALRAVPRSLREGAYALAATRSEVTTRVVFPAALSGVVAAILLALARAIGETMAVAIAAGMTPKLTWNPMESIQTMTSYIVQVSLGDTPAGTIEYQSLFAVAMTLFAITLTTNIIANRVMRRFREVYE